MPLLSNSHRISRISNCFFLSALVYFLLLSVLPVEAQKLSKKDLAAQSAAGQKAFAESLIKNPWSNIKGFRSAKFGMDEKSVYRAIAKDFKITKKNIKRETSAATSGGTTSFIISVPKMFSTGGTATIGYIFGYKSKKLSHINVIWGGALSEKVEVSSIVDTANLLRSHFIKKRYKVESLVANGKISDESTLVFRGKDKKNRMVVLILNTIKANPTEKSNLTNTASLVLSYIENHEKPDVHTIVIGDDEF